MSNIGHIYFGYIYIYYIGTPVAELYRLRRAFCLHLCMHTHASLLALIELSTHEVLVYAGMGKREVNDLLVWSASRAPVG